MRNPAAEYRRQFQWRDWGRILEALPPIQNRTVADLGCGVGDLAAELAARGAFVTGFDASEDLIQHARSRGIPNATFRTLDLRGELDGAIAADGIWCSFTVAYFVDLAAALARWRTVLKPGGWIAITEIDDLFGHEPLPSGTKAVLDDYSAEALAAGRYDFRAGRRLAGQLEQTGFRVERSLILADRELSFDGPAETAVIEAWRARLDRMKLLEEFAGAGFAQVKADFLSCLQRADHVSQARVCSCLAFRRP